MVDMSPGVAGACFSLLRIISQHQISFPAVRAEFPRIDALPIEKLIYNVQEMQWAQANENGSIELTPRGMRLIGLLDGPPKLRRALLDYVELHRPVWVKNTLTGRSATLSFSPPEVKQCLVEAEVAKGFSEEVVSFWDALRATADSLQDAFLNEIGRAGERLTIRYEERRTGHSPVWKAIESNVDGYDVQSVFANSDLRPVQIEVKASTQGIRGSFHLTRNEWLATVEMPLHQLHLWDLKSDPPRLAILPRSSLQAHIPVDQNAGKWESVRIPFKPFEAQFVEIS